MPPVPVRSSRLAVFVSRLMVIAVAVALVLATAPAASAFTREEARGDGAALLPDLALDCTLTCHDMCSGWVWVFNDVEGAVWGAVLNPADCWISCTTGGVVQEVSFYSRCSAVPGRFGGLGISMVDGVGCRTTTLYESGPLTVTHCISGDRWTIFTTPSMHLYGNPFAVTVTWGPQSGGSNNPQFATDNGIANLYCRNYPSRWGVFPGCATSTSSCAAWSLPPQRTFIYVTDFNGDGVLDDLCALYGAPYPLAFPYFYPYGYLPNNLIIMVGLDCFSPQAVEETSWGKVKALFR